MKRTLFLPAILSIAILASCKKETVVQQEPAEPITTYFKAALSGDSEVPTHSSNGYGSFDATLRSTDRTLTYKLTYSAVPGTDFKPTVAHIHKGMPGINGNATILFDLGMVDAAALNKSIVLTPEQVADLQSGNLYVHIHSHAFPEGDIRGQIVK